MDRIIIRLDQLNTPTVFLVDSIKDNKITMWQPGRDPQDVSLEFYHSTKLILEKGEQVGLTRKIADQYSDTWEVDVLVMQRLPRNFRINQQQSTKKTTSDRISEQERAYYMAVKAQNDTWEVLSSTGEIVGFASSKDGAKAVLNRLYH